MEISLTDNQIQKAAYAVNQHSIKLYFMVLDTNSKEDQQRLMEASIEYANIAKLLEDTLEKD